ncbi:hypothetical protein V8E36_001817 [Tilletia maclaganii]
MAAVEGQAGASHSARVGLAGNERRLAKKVSPFFERTRRRMQGISTRLLLSRSEMDAVERRTAATGIYPGSIADTPNAHGVSGFIVPSTPRGATPQQIPENDYPQPNRDVTLSAIERVAATRQASDESSPEVVELRAELWAACLECARTQHRSAAADIIVAEAEKLTTKMWLEIRKDLISRGLVKLDTSDRTFHPTRWSGP